MAEQPEECSPPSDDRIETSSATASMSSTAPPPSREVSRAEAELRRCFHAEVNVKNDNKSMLVHTLLALFEALPPSAVPHCRAELDASIVFRQSGSLVTLRSLVFESGMAERAQRELLRIIERSCTPPPRSSPGFVVLSDVDDTMLPGKDLLNISGCDRTWHQDGSLYPGVSCFHRQLRHGLRDAFGGDYTVLLTARPPWLLQRFFPKFKRIAGIHRPRLSILPGEASHRAAFMNTLRVLGGNYTRIGDVKHARMKEYAQLFPDYVGRFVFIGDDGQADMLVAEQLLEMRCRRSSNENIMYPAIAWVAVKACNPTEKGRDWESQSITDWIRTKHPPLRPEELVFDPPEPGLARHRFFYFEHYLDLAEQLANAGWITTGQRDAVEQAYGRDLLPDPVQLATQRELADARAVLTKKLERGLEDADDAERMSCQIAEVLIANLGQATVRLEAPPEDSLHAPSLSLKVVNVSVNHGMAVPPLIVRLWAGCAHEAFEIAIGKEYVVPLSVSSKCSRREDVQVATLEVASGRRQVGTCHITTTNHTGSAPPPCCSSLSSSGGEASVRLLPFGFGPEAMDPVGLVSLQVRWRDGDNNGKTVSSFAAAQPAGAANFL